jgi:hypothetical protein
MAIELDAAELGQWTAAARAAVTQAMCREIALVASSQAADPHEVLAALGLLTAAGEDEDGLAALTGFAQHLGVHAPVVTAALGEAG